MKKIYFLTASLLMSAGVFAQTTITNHFEGALVGQNWEVGYYSWNEGNGYVSGSNSYEDQAIIQKFDMNYGVTGEGTIDKLSAHIILKEDSGNGTEISLGVWEDNSGVPGALLGSANIAIADIDTTTGGIQLISDGISVKGFYNVEVTFASPIAIPANKSFFAGVTLPTVSETAQGDTIVVTTTTMAQGGTFTFADATTHAGSMNGAGGFDSYGASGIAVSNAIFPTVTITGGTGGINDNVISVTAYPNPAADMLTVSMSENASSVSVISMDGKVVATQDVNGTEATINVSSLNSGVYFYEVATENGNIVRKSFVKK